MTQPLVWEMNCIYYADTNLLFKKKDPSGCLVLIYSSSDLLEPPEENFK